MNKHSPEFILYIAKAGKEFSDMCDRMNHYRIQKLKQEGKTLYMAQQIDLNKIYCCRKCNP